MNSTRALIKETLQGPPAPWEAGSHLALNLPVHLSSTSSLQICEKAPLSLGFSVVVQTQWTRGQEPTAFR